jgi:hypothetical protein
MQMSFSFNLQYYSNEVKYIYFRMYNFVSYNLIKCQATTLEALFPVAHMCSCILTFMTRRFRFVWSFADQFLESDFSTYKECRPLLIQCCPVSSLCLKIQAVSAVLMTHIFIIFFC